MEIPKEYQGFLLNPIGDLAVLKIEQSTHPICVDWSDLTNLLQVRREIIEPGTF